MLFPAGLPLRPCSPGKLALLVLVLALLADLWLLSPGPVRHAGPPGARWNAGRTVMRTRSPSCAAATPCRPGAGADELPVQFQRRDLVVRGGAGAVGRTHFDHTVRPVERGVHIRCRELRTHALRLAERRFVLTDRETPMYPAYLELRKYELLAISDRLTLAGIKRVRRVAQHAGVRAGTRLRAGDDRRTVNWKATARRGRLMVNQYQDKRPSRWSPHRPGRVMKMPFRRLSLLDHAINRAWCSAASPHKEGTRPGRSPSATPCAMCRPSRQRVQMRGILRPFTPRTPITGRPTMEGDVRGGRRQPPSAAFAHAVPTSSRSGALLRAASHLQRLARHHSWWSPSSWNTGVGRRPATGTGPGT